MKTPKTIKGFNAVSSKHKAALKIYKKIKDMSPQQELEFWKSARSIQSLRGTSGKRLKTLAQ
jgi:hypothetical protein